MMKTPHPWIPTLVALALLAPGGCDDPEIVVDEQPATPPADELPAELGLGAEGDDVTRAHAYLRRYGYFPNPELAAHYAGWTPVVDAEPDDPELFDLTLEEALSMFQQNHGLPVTGRLDAHTRKLMQQPRCGAPDNYVPPRPGHGAGDHHDPSIAAAPPRHDAPPAIDDLAQPRDPSAYTPLGYTWGFTELKYGFAQDTLDTSQSFQRDAVRNAMNTWSAVAPVRWAERPNPDVLISFLPKAHGHGGDFQDIIYAHAFGPHCALGPGAFGCHPLDGDIHFNDETYTWGVGNGGSVQDIQTIALHELGHSLGLDHSSDTNAIMYAYNNLGVQRRALAQDDINGIKALYPYAKDLRVFDVSWYERLNPALSASIGGDLTALSNHWLNHGLDEGRVGSPAFDIKYYLQLYPDLGNGYTYARWHWRDHGIMEGRRGSPAFDAPYYMTRYPDLAAGIGSTNYLAALIHWVDHGIYEGRRGSADFDPVYYLQAHPDVANAYGATNYAGGLTHWLLYGRSEGRQAAP